MGPIFNKKVVKKYNLWNHEQYTYALFTVNKVKYCGLEKKKKRGKRGEEIVDVQTKQSQNKTLEENNICELTLTNLLRIHNQSQNF